MNKPIPVDYLTRLNDYYDEWYDSYDLGKSLLVDTNDLDFLENEEDFKKLVQKYTTLLIKQNLLYYL
jgi:deoxyadenosine/deoxycytidine kinase